MQEPALRISDQYLLGRRSYAANLLLDAMRQMTDCESGSNQDNCGFSETLPVSCTELDSIFASASLDREGKTKRKDPVGRFDEAAIQWEISRPWIDVRAQEMAVSLGARLRNSGPNCRVFITHDVDRTTGCEPTSLFRAGLRAAGFKHSASLTLADAFSPTALVRNVERLLDFELARGIQAVYFLLSGPYSLSRYGSRTDIRWKVSREIAKLVHQAGMTIGLHGSFYATDCNSYLQEKDRIEQALGWPITCHRNHYLRFDSQRLPRQLEEAGIDFDFSVGFRSAIGFRSGCAHVYRAFDPLRNRTSRLRLVPLVFMDTILYRLNETLGLQHLRGALIETSRVRGVISLLFHTDTILEHPRGWSWFESLVDMCEEIGADLSGSLPSLNSEV